MDIDFPVTRTKILIPRRRAEIVSRQRLLDTLNDLLDNKLMIVAAPAGYGKTSLLIDFIHHSEMPHCWYSLDTLDRDPQRFIAHFIASIHLRFPTFGQSAAQAFNNSSQDRLNIDSLVTAIINDAYENIHEHFVIVLDDYHLVRESKQVDHFISRFIQDVDENCHLIIASRTLLTLPDLPLMVARSQVGGMSFEELSFRPVEIQEFLQQNYKRSVSESEAEDLALQTEGWITGLLLSTQMMGKEIENRLRLARVSGVGLYEYLAQQVLQQQSDEMQEFLLRTSLLDEFDSDSCEEVIGKALQLENVDWDAFIGTLFQNNLFVLTVGEERIWLRYHHLFRDFLRERISRERPSESQKIQLRLAESFIERSEWDQAFALYQRLGQMEAIANLAEKAGPSLTIRGRLVTLAEWLNDLPAEMRVSRPGLVSLMASVTVMRGDTRQGLNLFNQAVTLLSNTGEKSQLAWALVRRSSTYRMLGDYNQAMEDAEQALRIVNGDSSLILIEAEALRSKGSTYYHQGRLIDALTWLNRAIETYQALKDEENVAKVSLEIGKMNEALGNYLASERAYLKALEIWQATGNTIWQANLLNNLGVLQHLLGDYETAASTLEKAVQYAREGGYPRMEAFALTSIGDLYRDLEATNEALDAYRWARLIAKQIMDRFLLLYLDLAEAGMARSQGQFFQANDLLVSARQTAEESQSPYEQHLCLMESGCLKVARKDYQLAVHDLDVAAHFFSKEGHRVEAIRAHLYLVVALFATGSRDRASEYCTQLFSLVSGPENRHPLVTVGREVRLQLENMYTRADFGALIGEFLEQIRLFEERVPQIRRNLRRRALAVPFAPPKMVIRALGRMQVKVNDHIITSAEWQTQSCRDLFFSILAHPEGLSKEDIGAIFWPDASLAELKLRFKNNVYRVRHAVGKDSIYLQEDYYYFNRQMDYEYDAESFLRDVAGAEQAESIERKLDLYLTSLKLYKGAYLPEIEETWVIAERERLKQIYLDVLLKVAELYLKQKQFAAALTYCQRALKEDSCLEAAHRLAMRIHIDMGNRALLVRQYEECRKALLEEIGVVPSAQTQELFESLLKLN
jgi:LuxR family transcriptional regulator, maltose regulon positive regulatory protein